VAQPDKSFSA
jgi:hypothetical protein